jgi:hypothetical protein
VSPVPGRIPDGGATRRRPRRWARHRGCPEGTSRSNRSAWPFTDQEPPQPASARRPASPDGPWPCADRAVGAFARTGVFVRHRLHSLGQVLVGQSPDEILASFPDGRVHSPGVGLVEVAQAPSLVSLGRHCLASIAGDGGDLATCSSTPSGRHNEEDRPARPDTSTVSKLAARRIDKGPYTCDFAGAHGRQRRAEPGQRSARVATLLRLPARTRRESPRPHLLRWRGRGRGPRVGPGAGMTGPTCGAARCRSTARTRAGGGAAGSGRPRSPASRRSRSRSGPA